MSGRAFLGGAAAKVTRETKYPSKIHFLLSESLLIGPRILEMISNRRGNSLFTPR